MRNFAFGAFLLIIVSASCFITYISFNYVLYNPDSGVDTLLNEKASEMMNANNFAKWTNTRSNIATGFGMMGVISLFIAILLFVIGAVRTSKRLT